MFLGPDVTLAKVVLLVVLGVMTPWAGRDLVSLAQQCVGVDACSCRFDDGSGTIDISSLANNDNSPRFNDVPGDDFYLYSYNPCRPFSELGCSGASLCQISSDQTTSYQAGDADKATWSFDGNDIILSYLSDQDPSVIRQAVITLVCDQSATTPVAKAIGETVATVYEMTVTTKCACRNGCAAGPGGSGGEEEGLSPGSVVVIIFFVLLIVYLVAGVVFNKTRNQATGLDLVPNSGFWITIPGLIKDGFLFTCSRIRSKKSGYDEV